MLWFVYFFVIKNRLFSSTEIRQCRIILTFFSARDINVCVFTTPPDGKTQAELIPGCQGNKLVTSSLLLIVFLLDGLYVLWFNVLLIKTSRHNYNRKAVLFWVLQSSWTLSCISVCVKENLLFGCICWAPPRLANILTWNFGLIRFWWSHGVTPRLYTHALALFHDISDCLLCIFSAGFWETPLKTSLCFATPEMYS